MTRFWKLAAVAVGATLLAVSSAEATAVYKLDFATAGAFGSPYITGGFDLTTADYISSTFTFTGLEANCWISNGDCTSVRFTPSSGFMSEIAIFSTPTGGGDEGRALYFPTGSFEMNGVYPSIAGAGGTLSVSGGIAAIPEPATWAMLLTGFFGVGAIVRRRREDMVAA